MNSVELVTFSYFIVSILSFFLMCNTFSVPKDESRKPRITPEVALLMSIIWPIGLLAAYIAFIRGK